MFQPLLLHTVGSNKHNMSYLLTYSMEQSPSWLSNLFSASQEIPLFYGPGSSLPHLQVPAICPYPEPARSSPYPHIPLLEVPILILSSHLRMGLPRGLLPSGFPTKTLYTSLLSPTDTTCLQTEMLMKYSLCGLSLKFNSFSKKNAENALVT